ncbi:MAG: hypothetical protein ABIQ93_02590 [Saprospiraceae bacterium]
MTQFRRITRVPRLMLRAFVMEGIETKQMARTFLRQGKGRWLRSKEVPPTEAEKQQAMEQLRDLPRFIPFFMLLSMPLPGVTESYVLLAVTLEKWSRSRVTLLPSNFRQVFAREKARSTKQPPRPVN